MFRRVLFVFAGSLLALITYGQNDTLSFNSAKFDSLLKTAKVQSANAYALLKEVEQVQRSDFQRLRLNRHWALYYFERGARSKALDKIAINLKTSWDGLNNHAKVELVKSHSMAEILLDSTQTMVDFKKLLTSLGAEVDHHLVGENYVNMGNYCWYNKRFLEAATWYQIAMQYSIDHGIRDIEAKAYFRMGNFHLSRNQRQRAKQYYLYSSSIYHQEKKSFNPLFYVDLLNALATILTWEQKIDSAVFIRHKALVYLENEAENRSDISTQDYKSFRALILNNLSQSCIILNRYDSAISYAQQSIQLYEDALGKSNNYTIKPTTNLGIAYLYLGELGKSKTHLLKALNTSKSHKLLEVKSYCIVGQLHQEMELYEEANLYYDSALTYIRPLLDDEQKVVFDLHIFNRILMSKSQILRKSDKHDIVRIEELYQLTSLIISFSFAELETLPTLGNLVIALENLCLLYSELYQKAPNSLWLDRILTIMEAHKSRKLFNQLEKSSILSKSQKASSTQKLHNLKRELNLALAKSNPGKFDSAVFMLQEQLDTGFGNLDVLKSRTSTVEKTNQVISTMDYRQKLKEDEMSLIFFEGDDYVIMLKLSAKEAAISQIDKYELFSAIQRHNQAIVDKEELTVLKVSSEISAILGITADLKSGYQNILIVPDGIIWSLNFAALKDTESGDYWGKAMNLAYNHFVEFKVQKPFTNNGKVLAFAFNPDQKEDRDLGRDVTTNVRTLPGTSQELLSISEMYPGKFLYGNLSSETSFKENCSKYEILHLAVHGYENSAYPDQSYLQFATHDSENDGKLHAYEIYNLELDADLAVLSACHSGHGELLTGEGMMSLGRAFSYAGVKSVLISRWEVSDYSAPFLMQYFYSGLKEGMHKSEALKYAQTMYLENHSDALTASPFYWSSFYILGDDSPLYTSAAINPWMLLWLALVLLSSQLFLRKRTRSSSL